MSKRQIPRKTNETGENKIKKAITPKLKKEVTSKSGKSGAKNTAPKKVKNDDTIAPQVLKKTSVKKTPIVRKPKIEASNVNEDTKQVQVVQRIGPAKTKNIIDARYIRISEDSDIEKFKEMNNRIQSGSIQWAYYAIDGEKGYHYYLVLKN